MENIITKRSQLKTVVLLIVFIFLFLFSVFAITQSLNQTNSSSQDAILNMPVLADVIDGKSIINPETQEYIRWYNNFSSLHFEEIGNKTEISTAIEVGNFDHELKGFTIDNKMYAIELVSCDEKTKGCGFKINGIDTGKIYVSDEDRIPQSFNLNANYNIIINSITFNYCDNKRFCDTHFEAYDLVDVEVIKKGD